MNPQILRARHVRALFGNISASTLGRWERKGIVPARRRHEGTNSIFYVADEIYDALEKLKTKGGSIGEHS
jgi:hypothetical protein